MSGREVVFFEDHVGSLAAHIAGGLAATATSYEAAAGAGLINRTTVQEVRNFPRLLKRRPIPYRHTAPIPYRPHTAPIPPLIQVSMHPFWP